jgi:Fe-Mn family superoxide dismutase
MHELKPLPFTSLEGISLKTNEIHHDKLYAGYVNKRNEIEEKIKAADPADANQIYSQWRGLKEGETFAANGMILHEIFFDTLGGKGDPDDTLVKHKIVEEFGSWDRFIAEFTATAMGARGWAILAYDFSDSRLHIYAADAQNQGGVWGAVPVLLCDVYEHAYLLDFGSDRKSYIAAYLRNIDWGKVDAHYRHVATGE